MDDASDAELVSRVLAGEDEAFARLMQRHNRRLFRIVRGVVGDDAEAEDVCQDAWLRAYAHLAELQHPATFSRWLGRIAGRCAIERAQRARGTVALDHPDRLPAEAPLVVDGALAQAIERAIDELAPLQRAIVLLREVEHMSTNEVADVLGISEQNVRVRLHRARASLRVRLSVELGSELDDVFRFDGERCARLAAAVLGRLRQAPGRPASGPPQSEARYAARSAR
jgi:RNA polymerase sigma-70 factor (ECF subfamily)